MPSTGIPKRSWIRRRQARRKREVRWCFFFGRFSCFRPERIALLRWMKFRRFFQVTTSDPALRPILIEGWGVLRANGFDDSADSLFSSEELRSLLESPRCRSGFVLPDPTACRDSGVGLVVRAISTMDQSRGSAHCGRSLAAVSTHVRRFSSCLAGGMASGRSRSRPASSLGDPRRPPRAILRSG